MAEYIDVPIVTDPDDLSKLAFDGLAADIPGWTPAAGNLDTILIEKVALIASVVANLAAAVPVSIFRFLGRLVRILPIEAAPATGNTTWTMIDTAGYTIPSGTLVGIRAAGDTLIPFQVVDDIVVTPGTAATAAGAVLIRAVTPGAAGSDLGTVGGNVELLDILDFVDSVALTGATTGGVDAEADAAYINRLTSRLQLLSDGLVLPPDFATYAQSVAGVDRALDLDGYNPNANEIEQIVIDATGGTYTLTFSGQTTGAIAYNATAATVKTALEALSNIAPGDVIVTGGPGAAAPIVVEFAGVYDGTDVTQMTANSASLTGATHTATITTTRQGSPRTGNEKMVAVAVLDENGNAVSGGVKTAVDALLQAKREVNFIVNVIDPTFTQIDVSFTVTIVAGFNAIDVVDRAEQAVSDYLSPANWGRPPVGDTRGWISKTHVRYLELATVINNVQGVDEITALTLGIHGGALTAADVTLAGAAALPQPVTIAGTAA